MLVSSGDSLEKEMATRSSILARKIPRTEEPGGLQSMGSQRVVHDWALMHANRYPYIHMVESESWSLQSWPLQRQFCPIPNFPIYVDLFLGSAIYSFWILNIFMYYFKHTNRYHWISLSSSQSKKLAQNSQLCAQHWDGKNARKYRGE